MPRTRCTVRNCPNHSDEGSGYHLIATPTMQYHGQIALQACSSEELFICAPCMGALTGRGMGGRGSSVCDRNSRLGLIHRLTGSE